jgi:hypothetical protein
VSKPFIYLIAALAAVWAAAFTKLMYDMTTHMERMTLEVTAMAADIHRLEAHIDAMGKEVGGIRASVERMGLVIQQGGQQLERMSPLRMLEGMAPGGSSR